MKNLDQISKLAVPIGVGLLSVGLLSRFQMSPFFFVNTGEGAVMFNRITGKFSPQVFNILIVFL